MQKLKLKPDNIDYETIMKAIERRLLMTALPFGRGSIEGRAIAEICRGWEEMLDISATKKEPQDAVDRS